MPLTSSVGAEKENMAGKKSPCNDFIIFLIISIILIILGHHLNGREKVFVQSFPPQSKLFKA